MKGKLKKLCALILAQVIIISSFSIFTISAKETDFSDYEFSQEQPFVVVKEKDGTFRYYGATGELDKDYSEAAAVISTKEDYYKAHNIRKKDIASLGSNNLPSSVDLSKSKYFPPIGNQGGLGSCATFSAVYYQFSYTVNQKNDIQATADNTRSPQIVYNFINAGGSDGTYHGDNFDFLKHFGAPSMKTVPYTDQDDRNWYAYEGVWRESIRNRLEDYFMYDEIGVDGKEITSPDDEDLVAIKTALNDGKVLGYSTYISSWKYDKLKANSNAPENTKFVGEECVTVCDGQSGGHAMTLVGYNDNLWIDVNGNDKVDNGEMGAFKIANSWGEGYANDGFAWVAYDALNNISCVENGPEGNRYPIFEYFRSITVRKQDDMSDIYFQYKLNTAKRTQHKVTFTVEKNGTEKSWQMFYGSGGGYTSERAEGAFDGTEVACDGVFVCPIDLIYSDFSYDDFEACSFSIEIEDTKADSNPLTIKDVRIVNDVTGKSYAVTDNLNTSVDGNKISYNIKETTLENKVIYYIGYDNPTLHYKIGNGEFKEVKMNECMERLGYNTKYVLENVPENVTLYFSDENGNIDNNNGKYYTADNRLNFFRTKNAKEALTITDVRVPQDSLDPGIRFFFETDTVGGYEPYNYQYTIENLDTGEIKYIYFEHKYEKSHVFNTPGNYRVTAEARDQAGDIISFTKDMNIIDIPFIFSELTSNSKTHFVGNTSSFTAKTECEEIISRGNVKSLYKFDIKDSNGNVVYTHTKKSTSFHLSYKKSVIDFDYIPTKAGDYTITVSSTDGRKEYAEKTASFSVIDKIIGDADSSGIINILDATKVQLHIADLEKGQDINKELGDADVSGAINIIDASVIQRYLASLPKSGQVGKIIEYIPPTEPETQPPTEKPTEKPTETPTTPVAKNTVTFTNSFSWSGMNIYCYYWSDSNTAMTSWPGTAMTHAGVNEFNEVLYTFDVPDGAQYLIFTNGSKQTTDIKYTGGEIRYYPISQTDSKGNNLVETW